MESPKRREPTHVIRIEIPIHSDGTASDFDPFRDALDIALNLSRAAYLKAICDDAQITLIPWPTHAEELYEEENDLRRAALWVIDNWDSQATQHLSMKALRRVVGRA